MRKIFQTLIVLLFCVGIARAQAPTTHVYPAEDTNNAFTGNETHTGVETFVNLILTGTLTFQGTTGSAAIGVNSAAGTPCTFLLPTTSPTAGQFLSSAAPAGGTCQGSWATPSGGGGSGCVITGVPDTSVVTIHPINTCIGSTDFTWDDGTVAKNLIAGDGTNTQAVDSVPLKNLQFTLGSGNASFGTDVFATGQSNTMGESTSPVSELYGEGQSNTLCNQGIEGTAGCKDLFTYGYTNEVTGSFNFVLGRNNAFTSTGPNGLNIEPTNSFAIGNANAVAYTGTGTSANLTDAVLIGDSNGATSTSYNAELSGIYSFGSGNNVLANGAGGTGAQVNTLTNIVTVGHSNQIGENIEGAGSLIYSFGDSTVVSVAGCTMTLSFNFGYHNQNACGAGTQTSQYLLGSSNTIITGGSSQSNIMGIGFSEVLNSCNTCMLIGSGGTNTTSNSIGIGLSSTPELIITPGALKFNAPTQSNAIATTTDCEVNSVSPAACVAACAGSFVVPTTTTTYTVNTTCPTTNNSKYILMPRTDATGLPSAPTCVTPAITSSWSRSAHVNSASFTMALPSTAGQTCWDFFIVSN
jgi:hypothetical protein